MIGRPNRRTSSSMADKNSCDTPNTAKRRRSSLAHTLRVLKKAGLGVAAIKHMPDGSVFVFPGMPEAVPSSEPNPWDAS